MLGLERLKGTALLSALAAQRRGPKPKGRILVCKTCLLEFYVRPSRAWMREGETVRFCSIACEQKAGFQREIGGRRNMGQVAPEEYLKPRFHRYGGQLVQTKGSLRVDRFHAKQDAIAEHLVRPWRDDDLYPLLLYRGATPLGLTKARLNYFTAMMEVEAKTVGEMSSYSKINGWTSPVSHFTGNHSFQLVPAVFNRFGARLLANPEITGRIPHLTEYLRFLRSEGGLRPVHLVPVSRWTTARTTKRVWRILPRDHDPETGQPVQEVVSQWPFIGEHTPVEKTDGAALVLAVDRIVPKVLPREVREDLCQDLLVKILLGETTLENLKDALPRYVKEAFRQSPLRYGDLSLEARIAGDSDDALTLKDILGSPDRMDRLCSECFTFSADIDEGLCPRCRNALENRYKTQGQAIAFVGAARRGGKPRPTLGKQGLRLDVDDPNDLLDEDEFEERYPGRVFKVEV